MKELWNLIYAMLPLPIDLSGINVTGIFNLLVLVIGIKLWKKIERIYKVTHSRQLLNSVPNIFTSLGILFTFVSICFSLSDVSSANVVDEASRVGKTVGELHDNGGIDLPSIVKNLIPAFTTSIWGIIMAMYTNYRSRVLFAKEDAEYEEMHASPEKNIEAMASQLQDIKSSFGNKLNVLERMYSHMKEQDATTKQYNEQLNSNIKEQSSILATFINDFVARMDDIFTRMQGAVEQQIMAFGQTQFSRTNDIMQQLADEMSSMSKSLVEKQSESVSQLMTDTNAQIAAITDRLTALTNNIADQNSSALEALSTKQNEKLDAIISSYNNLSQDSLSSFREMGEEMKKLGTALADDMSTMSKSLVEKQSESVSQLMADTNAQIAAITDRLTALTNNIADQNSSALEALSTKQNEKLDAIISSYNNLSQDSLSSFKEMGEEMKRLGTALADQNNNALTELNQQQTEKLNAIIAGYTELNKSSLESYQQMADQMKAMNNSAAEEIRTSLRTSVSDITSSISLQCTNLGDAIAKNVGALERSYAFIDKYVAQLKADYEQSTLAYTDAVQNAHDLNASFEDTIKQVDNGLQSIVTTNEMLGKIMKAMNERQTNIEALVQKMKEVGATIETLQKLETTLNKIVNR